MNSEYQDYELTAYLLGELDDERAAEIERILAASPEARAELEEIRATMDDVTGALAVEPMPGLALHQEAALEAEFQKCSKVAVMTARAPRQLPRLAAAAVAASLLGAIVLSWNLFDLPGSLLRKNKATMEQASLESQQKAPTTPAPTAGLVAPADRRAETEPEILEEYEIDGAAGLPAGGVVQLDPSKARVPTQLPGEMLPRDSKAQSKTDQNAQVQQRVEANTGMASVTELILDGSTLARTPGDSGASPGTAKESLAGIDEYTMDGSRARRARGVGAADATGTGFVRAEGKAASEPPALREKREMRQPATPPNFNTESYDFISDNNFTAVGKDPLSTFSIDVDTASYSNVRRFLDQGELPPPDAVRIEELINYFPYDYEPPHGSVPFAVHTEVAQAPWAPDHRLVRIALKGKEFAPTERPAANLVFLLDVSGSMEPPNKLPLVRQAMRLLVERLEPRDHVAIVVYAGSSGLVLPSTSAQNKHRILSAIDNLEAGGSTNGGEGIRLAYREALANFDRKAVNRVILATDGDFNVGVTNQGELVRLVQENAARGVFLTVLGFGMGNYKDSMLEKLADKGNGNYGYIDSLDEARKVLVEQMGGTLVTIAKDVKIQVEFNPVEVSAYRLIGYENRVMAHQDFDDDRKDAGDIGAGHTVTALYEVVPVGVPIDVPHSEPLKYQRRSTAATARGELLTVKLRYKQPNSETSQKIEVEVIDSLKLFNNASEDFRFASAVAAFGMLLRNSPYRGSASFEWVREAADDSRRFDPQGYRADFLRLVREARSLGR